MSVDIKVTYGAVGDGQITTTTITMSAVTNPTHLAVSSGIFASGDVGKKIAISYAGVVESDTTTATMSSSINPTHLAIVTTNSIDFSHSVAGQTISVGGAGAAGGTLYSTIVSVTDNSHVILIDACLTSVSSSQLVRLGGPILSTISSFTDSQHVVLADSCLLTVPSLSGLIEWGHDDNPAFIAFNNAQVNNSNVVLTIPAGRYCFAAAGSSLGVGQGVKSVNFIGTGSPVLTDMLGVGNGPAPNTNGIIIYNDNTAESFVQTVSAGATVLHMVTASDAGKYTPSTWAWMSGYDTQGFGAPPNPAFADFVFVTAIDAVAGTVTIQDPLVYSYKSTWPAWVLGSAGSGPPSYTGGAFSLGGPAKLYLINPLWDATQVWDGVNFRFSSTVGNCSARSMTIKNASFEVFGPNVSFQHDFTADNITVPTEWELDKVTNTVIISNSTLHQLLVQSKSPFNVTLNNCTIADPLNGVSANWTINNCTMPGGSLISPTSYGPADTISFTGNTFTTTDTFAGVMGVEENDINGAGGWSISNGLMSRTKTAGTGEPPQWAVPGSYFGFVSRYVGMASVWKCLDIYESGGTLFLQTDQSASSFPTPVNGSPGGSIGIEPVIPKLLSYSGNTGSPTATGWVGNRLFSHWLNTYSGNIGAVIAANLIQIWGQVISIKITVNSGYSAGTLNLDNPFVLNKPQNTDVVWSPSVDLTITGTRIITSSGVAGGGGSDSNLTLPNSGNIWLVPDQITPTMSGAVGAGSVQLEILTDQGFGAGTVGLLSLHR